ncbi:FtsX-like permease family protein [Elioraea sp. Yellowstone]|jgi:putative ABC transport system permease protein|uniref:ABC transporter permease n=1 Tax=Elioraea sp. Yellowstone TaxID=2592070 RepID=UPI0011528E3B|nr:FtsX-like permease family protein [Elioraea sp. Yellowstone]TQF77014.1 FtsX-like permease family protein [Elioraea sp. Yellowstone]
MEGTLARPLRASVAGAEAPVLATAWRLALRELRGGTRGLRIVIACLALGVAAIAGVGTLTSAVVEGMRADGRRILGGDLEVSVGYREMPQAARDWIEARGGRVAEVVEMRSMLVVEDGARDRMLVELKAVGPAYPLYGTARVEGTADLAEALAARDGLPGLAAEPVVADRLGLRPGARVRLGDAVFRFAGAILEEPDRVARPTVFGPRVMIARDALAATRLVQPGSLVRYEYRVRLPEGADVRGFIAGLRAAFPDGGWRIRTADEAAPGVIRFVEQTSLFLTLAGLTALLVGGIGVANGVRAWLASRRQTIATLKCLGAPAGVIFATYTLQLGAIAALGIALGLAAGLGIPSLAALLLADVLPVPPRLGIYPLPLALAAAFGLLTAATFALWPLARARAVPAIALFREGLGERRTPPRRSLVAANAALAMALVGLTVAVAQDRVFAAWFCAAAAVTLGLFRLGGWAVQRAAAAAPRHLPPALRLGFANLHRPGSASALMLVSLGLGLSTLASVAMIQGNLQRQVVERIPERAPAFFFIDIQNDQVGRFEAVAGAIPGVGEIARVPSLRARIVAVNGVPAEQVRTTEDTAWALRGDRGLTYAATPPEGTRLVAGSWWPPEYRGEPLVSFDATLARGWGIGVGDRLTVNVLGRDIELRIASLRVIDWRSLGLNFTLIASPGLLEAAPHTHIATVQAAPEAEAPLLRAVTDALPNVSAIRVRDALEAVNALLGRIGDALSSTGGVTLLSGALVLAGAIAAGRRQRIRDAVVLKTLGATRRQILAAYLVEFGVLGTAAGLLAAAVGSAASWAVTTHVMRSDWAFLPGTLGVTILACVALTVAFGWLGTAAALRAKPAPLLRTE